MTNDVDKPFIDVNSPLQVGLLVGLFGGFVFDAVIMWFVLRAVAAKKQRNLTSREIGFALAFTYLMTWRVFGLG